MESCQPILRAPEGMTPRQRQHQIAPWRTVVCVVFIWCNPYLELSFILPHVEHVHHCRSIALPQKLHIQVAGCVVGAGAEMLPQLSLLTVLYEALCEGLTVALGRFGRRSASCLETCSGLSVPQASQQR